MEAMLTVAEAALDRHAVLQPAYGLRTNVYAYAKRDLRRGERLDGPGGYACYGLIENCDDGRDRPGLPICLTDDVTLLRDVAKDERLDFDDAGFPPDDATRRLYLECVGHAAKDARGSAP
jgi:predicted homoserine dehydrogenase-like protein